MKKFIIGLVIGFVLGGTGAYAVVKKKVEKVATKENAEKVEKATKNFTDTITDIFK